MKNHHYRITVEHLSTPDGQAVDVPGTLQFECGAHDDILALVQRSRQRGDFDADTAASDDAAAIAGSTGPDNWLRRALAAFDENRLPRGPLPSPHRTT